MFWPALSRRVALALLVAMTAGPLGLAAVLHPADDAVCVPVAVGATHTASAIAAGDPAAEHHTHCAVCHAVRSARWALAITAVPGLISQPARVAPTRPSDRAAEQVPHPGVGRSPPRRPAIA